MTPELELSISATAPSTIASKDEPKEAGGRRHGCLGGSEEDTTQVAIGAARSRRKDLAIKYCSSVVLLRNGGSGVGCMFSNKEEKKRLERSTYLGALVLHEEGIQCPCTGLAVQVDSELGQKAALTTRPRFLCRKDQVESR